MNHRLFSLFISCLAATAFLFPVTVNGAEYTVADEQTLRSAIDSANDDPDMDTITISAGQILLDGGQMNIATSLVIQGAPTTLDAYGGANGRIFNVEGAGIDVTLKDLTIENGNDSEGGCIRNAGGAALNIQDSTVQNCESYKDGGGIINLYGSTLRLINSEVRNNFTENGSTGDDAYADDYEPDDGGNGGAGPNGGGIANYEGRLEVTDCIFEGNYTGSGGDGGRGGNYTCTGGWCRDNVWAGDGGHGADAGNGGGLFSYKGEVIVKSSVFRDNGTGDGGAGGTAGFSYHLSNDGNGGNGRHGGRGGGLFVAKAIVTIEDSEIYGNQTGDGGRGGYCSGGNCHEGTGGWAGSGVGFYQDGGTLTIIDSTVRDNTGCGDKGDGKESGRSCFGAGIYTYRGKLTVKRSAIYGNETMLDDNHGRGAGVFNENTEMWLENVTISNNKAKAQGGGLYIDTGYATSRIKHCTITGNEAGYLAGGGGVYSNQPNPSTFIYMHHNIILGNTHFDYSGNVSSEYICDAPRYSLIGEGYYDVMTGGGPYHCYTGDVTAVIESGPADNGGPTPTHALIPGGPAIDAGNPGLDFAYQPDVDQRGEDRIEGAVIDIGAYEVEAASIVKNNPIDDANEGEMVTLTGEITISGKTEYTDFTLTVDWGDGIRETVTEFYPAVPDYSSRKRTFQATHTYLNDGLPYVVQTTLEETSSGLSTSDTTFCNVYNVTPTVDELTSVASPEGSPSRFDYSAHDPGPLDVIEMKVDWGDQTSVQTVTGPSGTATHAYSDDGVYHCRVTISDDDGGRRQYLKTLIVENAAPSLSNISANTVAEGSVTTLTGGIADPGENDAFELTVDWGDGSPNETFTYSAQTAAFSETHSYADSGEYTVHLTLKDDDDGKVTESATGVVNNVAPTPAGLSATDVDESQATELTGEIADPSSKDAFTLSVAWGDGTSETFHYPAGTADFAETHTYEDDHPDTGTADDVLTVEAVLTDDDGGSNVATTTLTVTNQPPQLLTAVLPATAMEGEAVQLTGTFSDAAKDRDTFRVEVNWGDGTPVDVFPYQPAADVFTPARHRFVDDRPAASNPTNVYTAEVTLRDDDTGTGMMVTNEITISNASPSANPDTYSAVERELLTVSAADGVLKNDADPGNDALTAVSENIVTNFGGSVTVNADGSFTYDSTSGLPELDDCETGNQKEDGFQYTVEDGDGGSATGEVVLRVACRDATGIVYVDQNAAGGGDGNSWTGAFIELQTALAAVKRGQSVYVAQGTYYPDYDPDSGVHTGNGSASFRLRNHVKLYGGFPAGGGAFADRDPDTHETFLDGNIDLAGLDDTYTVIEMVGNVPDNPYADRKTVLDGFTITGGYMNTWGGGLLLKEAGPTVRNCTFVNNTAFYGGGAAVLQPGYNADEAPISPLFEQCRFFSNTAVEESPSNGGKGGGLYIEDADVEAVNCLFTGNTASYGAGVFIIDDNNDNPVTIRNTTVTGNHGGGGVGVDSYFGAATIIDSILWGNTCPSRGVEEQVRADGYTTISYTDIEGGIPNDPHLSHPIDGGGNINQDPLFENPVGGNYRLQPASPCIDTAGDNGGPDNDLDGAARPLFAGSDMGAYEYHPYDSDGDGNWDEDDECPENPYKTGPGSCGCWWPSDDALDVYPPPIGNGVPDCVELEDYDNDGILTPNDNCPVNANPDQADTDGDLAGDACDGCPADEDKYAPGECGCGNPDTDSDGDGLLDCNEECPEDPNKTEAGICGCGVVDGDTDGDGVRDCDDECPDDPDKTEAGVCGCNPTDTDNDGTADCVDDCPGDPNKTKPGVCGCGVDDDDTDGDGTKDCNDECPDDPNKRETGDCGCGNPETDTDGDGTPDCIDGCGMDPGKTAPGICGCNAADTDTDGDGTKDCNDECPNDIEKTEPGACGCGTPDGDTDADGVHDCNDGCPGDSNKRAPGVCGCNAADTDTDGDLAADCDDGCPNNADKFSPGVCGCDTPDTDTDGDGAPDCTDQCINDRNKTAPGVCGCGIPDADTDADGILDCNEECPGDPDKSAPGICGCGVADDDTDGDGTKDCNDDCPDDAGKTMPGVCGCGVADDDTDGDGTKDCNDGCDNDPNKTLPGVCGCGNPETDTDADGTPDCTDGCPDDPNKTAMGRCGCKNPETDTDGDFVPDCVDQCPTDPDKSEPEVCGCGNPETDTDNDDTPDCVDECPDHRQDTEPGFCGCGAPDPDTPGDFNYDNAVDMIDLDISLEVLTGGPAAPNGNQGICCDGIIAPSDAAYILREAAK